MNLVDLTGRSVLDVGCGAGNLALLAADRGARAYASDIMPEAVIETSYNAAQLKLQVQIQISDGLEYWIANRQKFDVIICNPPCVDELETIAGPSKNPFSNSFLIKELLNTYKQALNDSGCLLFVVSGQKNMMWADLALRERYRVNSFIDNREVCFQAIPDESFDRLCETGLVKRHEVNAVWDAYYFAIFHF
jgi:methylase of polypeptide subunit release factors